MHLKDKFIAFLKFLFFIFYFCEKVIFYQNKLSQNQNLNSNRIFDFQIEMNANPHIASFAWAKFKPLENITFNSDLLIVLSHDLFLTTMVVYSISSLKTLRLSILLFAHSIITLSFLIYKEFILDQSSDFQMSHSYKRFLTYFVPVYYSETIPEFVKAAINLLISKEFIRTTICTVNLVILAYICILSFINFPENKKIKSNLKIEFGN